MPSESDESRRLQSLLDLAADGDPQAYDRLLGQAADRLLRLTRKMFRAYPALRRWEQTDDVFQTAAVRLLKSLESVRPPNVAAFWGLAAAQIRRSLIDLARHHFGPHGAAAHHASTTGGERGGKPVAAREDGPETLAEWSEFHTLVDELPAEEKQVFQLAWYAGLPQPEIAALLDVSPATVQRRWYAAKIRLGRRLGADRRP